MQANPRYPGAGESPLEAEDNESSGQMLSSSTGR